MGTTLTAFQNDSGVKFVFVVAIEGFDYLITDGDTAAVLTAWAATEWTQALGGLQLMGSYEQKFEPWEPSLEAGLLSFGVMDTSGTGADVFGTAIHARGAGVETYLEESLDCTDSPVKAKRVNDFATSGQKFIDNECFTHTTVDTASTPDEFDGTVVRGKFAPFKASSETQQRFGREHRLPLVADGVYMLPKITSVCREFRGKWVGVWAHRVSGTTLDTRAQAQCIFAGKIIDWSDAENGMTIVTCEDAKGAIRDCTLLHRQWHATVADGIYLSEGQVFGAADSVVISGTMTLATANPLTVTVGAAGVNEIEPGGYTYDELASRINDWLASEHAAARLIHSWTYVPVSAQGTPHFRFNDGASEGNGVTWTMPGELARALGFDGTEGLLNGSFHWDGTSTYTYDLLGKVSRICVPSLPNTDVGVTDVRGEFSDNTDYLPYPPTVAGTFGVVQFNEEAAAIFESVDADTIRFYDNSAIINQRTGHKWDDSGGINIPYDEEPPTLRQVVFLYGDYGTILTSLLASTGTAAYNGTYDVLASQLGAAIPWEILGTNWTTSLASLTASQSLCSLYLDEPTRLMDAIGVDLVVRLATIVWKDQGLRIATWGTPSAALSTITLTASNKAADPKAREKLITVGQASAAFLVNILKLKYQRRADGTWKRTDSIEHPASINAVGPKAKTFELRNIVPQDDLLAVRNALLQSVEMFARPLQILRRTVNLAYFEAVAPGDFAVITDTNARNPAAGTRGVTSKPCLVVRHRRDFGGYEIDSRGVRAARCEVDVLILPLSNIAPYSPAADVDISQANGGYNAGTQVLTCYANRYSTTADNPDTDVEYFAIGDKVLVFQRDPDDPASIESWQTTITAVGTNTLTVQDALTGWTSTFLHSVISDSYGTAVTTQKADVYQADDADGMVENTVSAYGYGWSPSQTGPEAAYLDAGDGSVELYSTRLYGDGAPLDTHGERVGARLCNALVNTRTAICFSSMSRTTKQIDSGVRGLIDVLPIFVGPGDLLAGDRLLRVYAFLRRATNGAAESLYATLCREPPSGSSNNITTLDAPEYQLVGPLSETVSWSVTTNVWGLSAAEDVSIRAANPDTGLVWLVIEGEANVQTRGASGFLLSYVEA